MGHPYWPLFDLRLAVRGLLLRPMAETDLMDLASVLPPDVELDPDLPTYPMVDARMARGTALHQSYWESFGRWRPEAWRLGFVARTDGRLIGVQGMEATDFGPLATVETYSWLMAEHRGRGLGKTMRLAVLALAFDHLGADVAETEAWPENEGSLGVSRSLGYVDNGLGRHSRAGVAADMPRLRMTRDIWHQRHRDNGVAIDGFAECRHLFGLS